MTNEAFVTQLQSILQVATDDAGNGVIRFFPDGDGQQRFAISRKGFASGQGDYSPRAYGYHGFYCDGRAHIQVAPSPYSPEEEQDLAAMGAAPRSAAFNVQPSNIPDRVAANIWTSDRIPDDGRDSFGLFVSTADAQRPTSRNIGIRSDGINFSPTKTGIALPVDFRTFGEPAPPPIPAVPPYPGDDWSTNQLGSFLLAVVALYQQAGQPLNTGAGTWIGRYSYDVMIGGIDQTVASDKHLAGLKAALGLA